jgi:transcriptional regulator with GAF, ATPase, and Fis domain
LRAIQGGLGQDAGRAAFYRLGSRDRAVVDRAGYLQSEKAEVPGRLVEIASEQPDRVLSTEALRYVRVQQPEVRPLVSWLDERDAGAVALVLDDEVCVGMLLWPAAGRGSPLTIDEVRGLRQLTDHLGIAAGAASQLARARSRELDAEDAIARARSEVQRLEDRFERDAARRRALSERLARAVEVASYSPAAQSARLEMERIAAAGLPIAMVLPPGVDGETWAAAAHMASPRADGNLLLVQCSDEREQALELWKDATRSPTVLAREGTLVLIHPELLPLETQRYIGSGLREDMGLVVLLPANLEVLLEAGELDPHLAARFGARQLVLPDLASRAEDLRALAMHMLGPIGISLRGEGMGLSLQAQQLLNEHHWPGNEAELRSVLWRAALATRGLRVEADALAAAMGDGELHRSGPQKAAQR